MNRRDLFRFARKGDLFVPNDLLDSNPSRVEGARELVDQSGSQPHPSNLKGRSQVGYSRRFFMGALAAGMVSSGAAETWPLTDAPCVLRYRNLSDYVVGIDRSYGEDETVFARSVAPGNWIIHWPVTQQPVPVGGQINQILAHYLPFTAGAYRFPADDIGSARRS